MASAPPEAKQPGRKKQQSSYQGQQRLDGNSHKAKWYRDQPNHGKQNQRQERQRPAEHEQQAPSNEQEQQSHNVLMSMWQP
jgi:hypothetical protein